MAPGCEEYTRAGRLRRCVAAGRRGPLALLAATAVACAAAPVGDGSDPTIPRVHVVAISGDMQPTWSWTSGGGDGTYRYAFDTQALDQAGTPIADNSLSVALPMGGHTLYVQEKRGSGWSGTGQARSVVASRPAEACLGLGFACAIITGTAKCWGYNGAGTLGLGDTVSRGGGANQMGAALPTVDVGGTPVALSCGDAHVCAELNTGAVRCWGANAESELGLGDTAARGGAPAQMGLALPALGLGGLPEVLSCGSAMGAALVQGGALNIWGKAQGATQTYPTAVAVPLSAAVSGVAVGAGHSCVRLVDGSLNCWGQNDTAQLGLGDTASRDSSHPGVPDLGRGRTAFLVQTGGHGTCAVLDNGLLKCWGQTAFPNVESRTGDGLPAVDMGGGHYAAGVAMGTDHTCVLREDGAVKCWGSNGSGQLGAPGGSRGPSAGDAVPAVDLGTGRAATALLAGGANTCALLDSGEIKCWGDNGQGQLGLGDTRSRGLAAGDMGDALPAVALK